MLKKGTYLPLKTSRSRWRSGRYSRILIRMDHVHELINIVDEGSLDSNEIYEMFVKNGFNWKEEDLKTFFEVVDEDKDSPILFVSYY